MILPRLIYGLWRWSAGSAERRFRRALGDPRSIQRSILRRILRDNATSLIGERLSFAAITDVASFRRHVPLCRYEDYENEIAAIRAGQTKVLTAAPVTRLVPTGGSSGALKLVPSTAALERGFQSALAPWIVDLCRRHPRLEGGPAYWSVSAAMALPEMSSAVPIGFESDAHYLGRWLEPWVARVLVAPNVLRSAATIAGFQYATLLLLLAEAELRLISVWHPTFFALLWQQRETHWQRLLEDLAAGTLSSPVPLGPEVEDVLRRRLRPRPRRARELRALGLGARVDQVWPALELISAWTDGQARAPSAALQDLIAPIALEPKGLLATEAFVSVPYAGRRPLAITAHFFEFLDASGHCLESHELEVGKTYEVVVTTQGGFYRYRLGDQVEVDGRLGATPTLRFVGRADATVDLVGEKLNDAFIAVALAEALAGQPAAIFAMLAPDPLPTGRLGYTLFVDADIKDPGAVAARLTQILRANPHFGYALDLGQLAKLRVFKVEGDAHEACLRVAGERQRLGDVKPRALSPRDDWSRILPGCYLEAGRSGIASGAGD